MAEYQQPFGGAPRLGNAAPGEPSSSPAGSGGVDDSFGGAPSTLGDRGLDRGEQQVGRSGGGEVIPAPYGGGEGLRTQPPAPGADGSGDGTGAGATSGTNVP